MAAAESPEVYMLCGPAGSGKTEHAKTLVGAGAVRLSIDDDMARFGVPFEDYDPVKQYAGFEQEVLAEHRDRMIGLLAAGTSVVLDYGFPSRSRRDHYKDFITEHGGRWRLLYFRVPFDELWQRVQARNERCDGRTQQPIPEGMLRMLVDNFEVPVGEGEEVLDMANAPTIGTDGQ